MKKIIMTLGVIAFLGSSVLAQKIAYVDSDYMLSKIPDYATAQERLNTYTQEWQAEVQEQYQKIDVMYRAYQAEEVLLTEEMKNQREEEIVNKEKELKQFQKDKFGPEGELFRKRQELIKPIQDLVYEAVQDLAKNRAYDLILDKAGGVVMLFANPDLDKSDEVLRIMGYSGN